MSFSKIWSEKETKPKKANELKRRKRDVKEEIEKLGGGSRRGQSSDVGTDRNKTGGLV